MPVSLSIHPPLVRIFICKLVYVYLIARCHPSGEIRSPGWDGKALYPPDVDLQVRLVVTPHRAALLSFRALNFGKDVLSSGACVYSRDHIIITVGHSFSGTCQLICGNNLPKEELYLTEFIFVTFYTNGDNKRGTGFRLLYSLHNKAQTPEQFADGTWNCSVSFWASIQEHFSCNLDVQCAGREDEMDCPYNSPLCEPGDFILGHSCYRYVKTGEPITWSFASVQCQKQGRQLVSLNDVDEWRSVTKLLRQYHISRVFAGLHITSLTLPKM